MIWDDLTLTITVIVALLGWLLVHRLNSERDLRNKKREIVLSHLIEAYMVLTHELNREWTDERALIFESMVSRIQLFGTINSIEQLKQMIDQFTKTRAMDLTKLTVLIRNELRNELELEHIEGNVFWYRDKWYGYQSGDKS